ncbi:MAG: cysteine desulfurase family protein [Xanthobacteraceae bacterium]|nr:cysteine desulfurase family protein [Xanthobacteraceae bacterium]
MTRTRIYLDWNATAPLRPEARTAMAAAWDCVGNPSSIHEEGRAARRLVEAARVAVATAVEADPAQVVFTSGGTEANVLALSPLFGGAAPLARLITSAIEHPSVLAGGRFAANQISRFGVSARGTVDLDDLRRKLGEGPPALVSVMLANNETGAVQPVAEVAALVHAAGSLLHVDAVQAFGRIKFTIKDLDADLVTVSGHKIGAPKGVGALIGRGGAGMPQALVTGGGQERGRRAGTENVAAIAGFGAAITAAMAAAPTEIVHMLRLRRLLEEGLKASPDVVIFAEDVERLPNTTLFGRRGLRAETAVIGFDLAGIAVSSGAACSSGKVSASHVLAAMGVPGPLAESAVRLSLGPSTGESEILGVLEAWRKLSGVLGKDG